MAANVVPDLDAPYKPLNLMRPYSAQSMTFLHRGQTQTQVVDALYQVMYTPLSPGVRTWLLSSEFEVILTFIVCAVVLVKKKSFGKLWLWTKRDSTYGSFYVTNAVMCFIVGVTLYLVAWDLTAIIIASFSFAHVSTLEWLWVAPGPWTPLVVGSYASIHGFVVGCSPKSPLSSLRARTAASSRSRWLYLPVPKNPAIVNATLVIPIVLYLISTFVVIGLTGNAYYSAKALSKQILPSEILLQVHRAAHHHPLTLANPDALASDELIWIARRVAVAYLEMHRYFSINLLLSAFSAMPIWFASCVYGLPNIVSLIDHACSRYPQPLPLVSDTIFGRVRFLLTTGKPTAENDGAHISLNMWKMTLLAIAYLLILVVCVPLFAFVPIYIVAKSFPHEVARGNISPTIDAAIIIISVITICSCTFVAFFCTVATLDPLFRSAIGINLLRTQIAIDVRVAQHKSMHEEDGHLSPIAPDIKVEAPELDYDGERNIAHKPSASTLRSTKVAESENEYPTKDIQFLVDDIEIGRRHSAVEKGSE